MVNVRENKCMKMCVIDKQIDSSTDFPRIALTHISILKSIQVYLNKKN